MGTSSFAFKILSNLSSIENQIVAIFTAPFRKDKKVVVNKKTQIHYFAEEKKVPLFTPLTLKDDKIKNIIYDIKADVIVVASYGLIINKSILSCKKYGCINVHPSMLPLFRGASPIHHVILSGMKESAVCIMKMDEGIDTGPVLMQEKFFVNKSIFYQELEDYCTNLGANLLKKTLSNIENITPQVQKKGKYQYAGKISKFDGKISWNDFVEVIDRKIRAFHIWPQVYFNYGKDIIKILAADYKIQEHSYSLGEVVDTKFGIACKNGILYPKIVQKSGKKSLNISDFLRGYKIKISTILN